VTGRTPTGAAPGTSRKTVTPIWRHLCKVVVQLDLQVRVACKHAPAARTHYVELRSTAPPGQIDRMIIKSVFAALLGVTLTWTWKFVVAKVRDPAYPRHPLTKATQPALSTSLSTFPRVSAFPVTSLTTHSHTLHAHVLLESCGWFTTAWYVIVVCSTTTVASGGHSKLHQ
jgi:hypothetical protein